MGKSAGEILRRLMAREWGRVGKGKLAGATVALK
jgi:hypothetical protein